jgi:tRNA(fMet)-specific endonuclease VapC
MKVLDTDHCIAILRNRLDPRDHALFEDQLAATTVSLGELAHGAHRSARTKENMDLAEGMLSTVTLLPFDEASARIFGEIKAKLEIAGNVIEDLDLQIASIALRHNASLVTHNQRHFKRVPNLTLEDWLI